MIDPGVIDFFRTVVLPLVTGGTGVYAHSYWVKRSDRKKRVEQADERRVAEVQAARITADKEIKLKEMDIEERFRTEVSERFLQLIKLVPDLEAQQTATNRKLAESEAQRAVETNRCQQEIEILRTEIVSHRNRADQLQGKLDVAQLDVSRLQGQIAGLQGEVQGLKEQLGPVTPV